MDLSNFLVLKIAKLLYSSTQFDNFKLQVVPNLGFAVKFTFNISHQ